MKWLSQLFESKEKRTIRINNEKYESMRSKSDALLEEFYNSKSEQEIVLNLA